MRLVLCLSRQHDLGVTGDFDGPDAFRAIGQRHPAKFQIVLRRHTDLSMRLNLFVMTTELCAGLSENRFIWL